MRLRKVRQNKNIAFLEPQHIEKIYQAYRAFQDKDGFCKVVDLEEVLSHNASLNMPLYVSNVDSSAKTVSLEDALQNWLDSSAELSKSMQQLFETLG